MDRENSAQGDVGATCVSRVRESGWLIPLAELRFSRLFFTARPSSAGERGTLGPTTFPLWQEVGGPFRPTVERRRAGRKTLTCLKRSPDSVTY